MSIAYWQELIATRQNLIGGDIECIEGEGLYAGPIQKISLVADRVIIDTPWCARRTPTGWEKNPIRQLRFHIMFTKVNILGSDILAIEMMLLGTAYLYPKGYKPLAMNLVPGLTDEEIAITNLLRR